MMSKLKQLSQHLGYEFNRIQLLQQALTHRSFEGPDNERLEFLGDSIVNFIIAEALYHRFGTAKEGQLSHLRSRLVDRTTLAELARKLQIGNYLRLGPGELKTGGHQRDSILADAMEAIIAAIYFDAGMEKAKERVLTWYQPYLEGLQPKKSYKDAKTRLQEYLQAKQLPLPTYQIVAITGEPHAQVFQIKCQVPDLAYSAEGVGTSRRRAEQQAAEQLLSLLEGK